MLKILILILMSLPSVVTYAAGGFSAAEYFETVGPKIKRGRFPARVTFESVSIKKADFNIEGVWRIFIACSGHAVREEKTRFTGYGDGYHFGSIMMLIESPDLWGRMNGRKFVQAPFTYTPNTRVEKDESYVYRVVEDDNGFVAIDLNGVDLRPYRIREQSRREIILMTERSKQTEEFRGICDQGEVDQFVMARVPSA